MSLHWILCSVRALPGCGCDGVWRLPLGPESESGRRPEDEVKVCQDINSRPRDFHHTVEVSPRG